MPPGLPGAHSHPLPHTGVQMRSPGGQSWMYASPAPDPLKNHAPSAAAYDLPPMMAGLSVWAMHRFSQCLKHAGAHTTRSSPAARNL